MKTHPDINDTLRTEGIDAVRRRHDNAKPFKSAFYQDPKKGFSQTPEEPSKPTELSAVFSFLGDTPPSPPKELITGLLPANGVAVTGGQSSAGKTFITIYKAICLATTIPYFERRIVERVGTAFVAAEGRAIIPNRFAAALAKEQITQKLPIAWIKRLPDFSSAEGIKLFEQQLKARGRRSDESRPSLRQESR